jgi:glycosyltransferase involved in cell wall biosynthesis
MTVVMDVSALRMTRAGTARYIKNLLDRLDDVEPIDFGGSARASVLARELWWYPFRLSLLADADVLHCPTYYGPVRPRMASVVTVHDLAVLRHPEAFGRWTQSYVPRVVPLVVHAARRVIAVSDFTASEVERLLRVPRDRICVVPNAVDDVFDVEGPRADGDYVLAVGTLEPRKNLGRTIEAARLIGAEVRVVGASGWGGVAARGENVTWLGRLDDTELARQYRGARCLAYPSLYEGFGLPILEAMACGAPVVTSRGGATEEIAGDAAVLVDPLDVRDIAEAFERAAARRDELRPLGLERARSFSWDESARRTRKVYEEAM